MQVQTGAAFFRALGEYFDLVAASLPGVLAFIVIVAIGVAMGWLVRLLSAWILRMLGFDRFSYRTGFTSLLEKGNVRKQPSEIVGSILYWIVILASVLAALQALHVEAIQTFATGFLGYIPPLVVAVVIFIVGYLIMVFVGRTVLIAAVNARLRFAKWLSAGVQILIMLFTIAMAADELGIARSVIVVAFSILFGGIILALSLAFGLGAKDFARDWIKTWVKGESEDDDKRDGFSHV